MMKAVVSRGRTPAARALRRHSSCAIWRALPLARQRRLSQPAQRHRRAVGFEAQLVSLAAAVGGGAGDAGDLSRDEASDLAARAGRHFHQRHRQAVDPRPVARLQQHAIDRELEQIVLRPRRTLAGERDDMALVGGIVEHDDEFGTAAQGVEIRHRLAGVAASGNVDVAAGAGHQRVQIDIVDRAGRGECRPTGDRDRNQPREKGCHAGSIENAAGRQVHGSASPICIISATGENEHKCGRGKRTEAKSARQPPIWLHDQICGPDSVTSRSARKILL